MHSPEAKKVWIPRIAAGVLSGLGIAYLVGQGAAAQQRYQVEPKLPGIWEPAGAAPGKSETLGTEKSMPNFTKQVKELLDAYNAQFQAENKEPSILITEPVHIRISHPEGVFVRSVPDQKMGKIREVLAPDSDLGVQDKFVVVWNEEAQDISIWVARPGDDGPVFSAIYHKIGDQYQELAELTSESTTPSQAISAFDLVERFFPGFSPVGSSVGTK